MKILQTNKQKKRRTNKTVEKKVCLTINNNSLIQKEDVSGNFLCANLLCGLGSVRPTKIKRLRP